MPIGAAYSSVQDLAGAISKTGDGSEINCIDAGGFGAVTIVKAITIDCLNVQAGVVVAGTNGIIINAPITAAVNIRDVDFMDTITVPGLNGIRAIGAGSVVIDRVRIVEFTGVTPNGIGVLLNPTVGALRVTIVDSVTSNNTNGGVLVNPGAAVPVSLVILNTKILGNGGTAVGLTTAGGGTVLTATVTDSELSGSGVANSSGVIAKAVTGTAVVTVTGSSINDNALFGASANGAGATVRVGGSLITGNATGINAVNSGQAISLTGNSLVGNTTPGAFTSTIPTL